MIFTRALCIALWLCVSGSATTSKTLQSQHLGPYNVSSITVSGISSGAYMAVQMHIAYSMIISGAAAFAGVRSYNMSLLFCLSERLF
jgi:predicted esterase